MTADDGDPYEGVPFPDDRDAPSRQTRPHRSSRPLPDDEGVALALIGAPLINIGACDAVFDRVPASAFLATLHQAAWRAICDEVRELGDRTGQLDSSLVVLRAERAGADPEAVLTVLVAGMDACTSPSLAPRYADELLAFAARREQILAASKLIEALYAGEEQAVVRARIALDVTRTAIEPGRRRLQLVDWVEAFAGATGERPIVDGFLFRGRWTQVVAPAKQGKSEWSLAVAHALARGCDPTGQLPAGEPLKVLYCDAEMGRLDVLARLDAAGLGATDLSELHYSDLPEALNVVDGAAALRATVAELSVDVVVLDGLNGFVRGEENVSTAWLELYSLVIAPLKAAGVAILSNDNQGREKNVGGRGSSAKIDKADIVFELSRTESGIELKRTHTRTALAAEQIDLRIHGLDGLQPVHYTAANRGWPVDTRRLADLLSELGVPVDATRKDAREALRNADQKATNEALGAALRWRKSPRTEPRTELSEQPRTEPRTATDQGSNMADEQAKDATDRATDRHGPIVLPETDRPGGYIPGPSDGSPANPTRCEAHGRLGHCPVCARDGKRTDPAPSTNGRGTPVERAGVMPSSPSDPEADR